MTPKTAGSIILFDGECNLCDRSVQFILRRDHAKRYQFASLQSPAGRRLLEQARFRPDTPAGSVVLLENGAVYTKSTAALRIAEHLSGPWRLFYALQIVPAPLRDAVYNWVARNRYRLFGRRQTMIPTVETRARFLSD